MKAGLWMIDAIEEVGPVPHQEPDVARSIARDALYEEFRSRIAHNPALDRTLVSFQANKRTPFYGWFKYREGFSEQLVTYLLQQLHPTPGVLLDPFSGAGSAVFAARSLGWQTKGIELLPVGGYATQARLVANRIEPETFASTVAHIAHLDFGAFYDEAHVFRHIPITKGAYPIEEEKQLIGYLAYCHDAITDKDVRSLLLFAAFSILEDISFTRKDGQYLRWDARAGRRIGKKAFNKGYIPPFREAIRSKLRQMVLDMRSTSVQHTLFSDPSITPACLPAPELLQGSSLDIMPIMEDGSVDFVLTSPPYANRYDYTRTYALELVYLGCSDEEVKQLRQTMLSCTVENRDKRLQLLGAYTQRNQTAVFDKVEAVFDQQAALHEVLAILEKYRQQGKLNNSNISKLVRNYFYEMCFIIYEMARVLKPGGVIAMVNDNVRYAGEEVPVDLILSNMAEAFGLKVQKIWTLGRGKGNSSQQMGYHGRSELRKCVYVWQK